MVTIADVKYVITADSKGAVKSIGSVDKAVGGMAKQAKKSQSPLKGMFKQIAIGVGSVIALRAAIRGMTRFMSDAIEKAKFQEQAEIKLAAALETTGRNVDDLLPKLKDHASAIQRVTTFGDEAVISASSLITQLTKLDEEGLKKATEGAVGMAAVFDQDLNAAATLVAKALAGNIGALSRYGIQVDKNLTMEEKRASILDQLSTMYERAQREADSFTGAQEQLSNVYGDLKEAIGDNIIKSDDMRQMLQDLRVWIESNKEEIAAFAGELIRTTKDAVVIFANAIGDLAEFVKPLIDWIRGLSDEKKELALKAGVAVLAIKPLVGILGKLKFALAGLTGPFGIVVGALAIITERTIAAKNHFEAYSDLVEKEADIQGKKVSGLKKVWDGLNSSYRKIFMGIDDVAMAQAAYSKKVAEGTIKEKERIPVLHEALGAFDDLLKKFGDVNEETEEGVKTFSEFGKNLPTPEVNDFGDAVEDAEEKLESIALTAVPTGRSLRTAFEGEAIPAARDFGDVLDQVPDKMDDIVYATEETVRYTTSLWDQMTDGLQTKWATMYGDFLSGAKSFENEYGDIWEAVKTQFFDIVGQMLAKFTTGFLDKIVGKAADAGASLLDNLFGGSGGGKGGSGGGGLLGNLFGGAGGAGGIWTGVGAAVGNLLGSLITGGKQKGAIDATNRELHNIWTEARHIYQDQAHILAGMEIIKWPIVEMRDMMRGGLPGGTERKPEIEAGGWLKRDIEAIKIRSRIRNKTLSDIRALLSGKTTVAVEPTLNVSAGSAGANKTTAGFEKLQHTLKQLVPKMDKIVDAIMKEPIEINFEPAIIEKRDEKIINYIATKLGRGEIRVNPKAVRA